MQVVECSPEQVTLMMNFEEEVEGKGGRGPWQGPVVYAKTFNMKPLLVGSRGSQITDHESRYLKTIQMEIVNWLLLTGFM